MSRKPKTPPNELAAWVRAVRKENSLSQDAFGAQLNPDKPIHRTTINRWERGQMGQRWKSIELIRKAFPKAPSPPVNGVSDPDRRLSSLPAAEGDYIVQTDQGRIVAKALDAIEDEQDRTRALRKCLEALDPSELGADKRPDPAQRK